MASKASKAEEFRNEITSKIITALESDTAPWQQPWNGSEAPHNAITRHQYNGINTVILSMAAMSMGVINNDNRWLTFNQASEAGYKIKAGSKGTHILLWKPTITTDEHGNREITSVLQRTFTVFHASQIEGIPAYNPPEINVIEAHEKAEKIIADSGVRIFFGGGEAYISPLRITSKCRPERISRAKKATIQLRSMSLSTLRDIRVGSIDSSVAADFHRNMRLKNW